MADSSWDIQILIRCRKHPISKQRIRKIAGYVLQAEQSKIPAQTRELSIVFCNDKTIHSLNLDFRGKDKPTDVLSFSQLENCAKGMTPESLGDVIISIETAIINAKRYRTSVNKELNRLLVHGILHLIGYEHENVTPATAKKMFARQRILCKRVDLIR